MPIGRPVRDGFEPAPLKAWKRGRSTGPANPERTTPERPMMCGGPEYTRAERLELVRQKQREMDEAARREREEAEAREAAKRRGPKPADDEDEYPAGERPRKDRYAVTLLRQDDSAWGGGSEGSGVLG